MVHLKPLVLSLFDVYPKNKISYLAAWIYCNIFVKKQFAFFLRQMVNFLVPWRTQHNCSTYLCGCTYHWLRAIALVIIYESEYFVVTYCVSCLVIYFMVLINSRMTCAVSVLTTVSVKCAKRRLSHFMYEDYLIVLFVYLEITNYTVLQIGAVKRLLPFFYLYCRQIHDKWRQG